MKKSKTISPSETADDICVETNIDDDIIDIDDELAFESPLAAEKPTLETTKITTVQQFAEKGVYIPILSDEEIKMIKCAKELKMQMEFWMVLVLLNKLYHQRLRLLCKC